MSIITLIDIHLVVLFDVYNLEDDNEEEVV